MFFLHFSDYAVRIIQLYVFLLLQEYKVQKAGLAVAR
jgi:hypothetical protein